MYRVQTFINQLPDDTIRIDISNKELTICPDLSRFKKLEYLNCSSNQLTHLPTLNENLQHLKCSSNQLTYLPELNENLQRLYCYSNPLYPLDSNDNIDTHRHKIQILTNFKHLYSCLKFKTQFRRWLWELVREPKIALKYHPRYLTKHLVDGAILEDVIDEWIGNDDK